MSFTEFILAIPPFPAPFPRREFYAALQKIETVAEADKEIERAKQANIKKAYYSRLVRRRNELIVREFLKDYEAEIYTTDLSYKALDVLERKYNEAIEGNDEYRAEELNQQLLLLYAFEAHKDEIDDLNYESSTENGWLILEDEPVYKYSSICI